MATLRQVGTFCPNTDCPTYANIEQNAIIRHGKTAQGKQRYRCKSCGKTFNENKGTLFYRKQAPAHQIIERTPLTMRHINGRLVGKALGYSKQVRLHKAAAAWQDLVYNLVRRVKTLPESIKEHAARFEARWPHRSPAMVAGLTDELWTIERVLRTIPISNNT